MSAGPKICAADDEDDVPQLSEHTLAALQAFYAEQETLKDLLNNCALNEDPGRNGSGDDGETEDGNKKILFDNDLNKNFPEDWQLSQFWYDEKTSEKLANEVLKQAGGENVACVSCPSIFRACHNAPNVHLFEFDRRFNAFGSLFHFYDYNEPEKISDSCQGTFSVVVADPPFLSEECLTKVGVTIKKLVRSDGKVILCTGAVMEPTVERVLGLKRSSFVPHHKNNLGNEFACFSNYEIKIDSADT